MSPREVINIAGPFCIESASILEVRFAATVDAISEVDDVFVSLFIDSSVVAESMINDAERPSNVALFYRGRIAPNTDVKIEMSSLGDSSWNIEPTKL